MDLELSEEHAAFRATVEDFAQKEVAPVIGDFYERGAFPILDEGRIAIAALAVGLAQGCLDESVRYARDRQAFGHNIGHYQVQRC